MSNGLDSEIKQKRWDAITSWGNWIFKGFFSVMVIWAGSRWSREWSDIVSIHINWTVGG